MSASLIAQEVLELLRVNPGLSVKQAIDTHEVAALQKALVPREGVAFLRHANPANRQFYTRQSRAGRLTNVWQSPLEYAVRSGTIDQAALLLQHGARITPASLSALCDRFDQASIGQLGDQSSPQTQEAFRFASRLVELFDAFGADWSTKIPARGVSMAFVSVYTRLADIAGAERVKALGIVEPTDAPIPPGDLAAQILAKRRAPVSTP